MSQKIYCYVDESGQDTKGKLFIVSVAIARDDRAEIISLLKDIEADTGKKTKWSKSSQKQKKAYIGQIVRNKHFIGKIYYRQMGGIRSYHKETLKTIALAIEKACEGSKKYRASIFIDGLQRPEWRGSATELHHFGILTDKVRGVKDEAYALVRLADAIAGFIREHSEDLSYTHELFDIGTRKGVITPL